MVCKWVQGSTTAQNGHKEGVVREKTWVWDHAIPKELLTFPGVSQHHHGHDAWGHTHLLGRVRPPSRDHISTPSPQISK